MSEVVAGTKVRCASIEPARWRPRVPSCNTRCDTNRKLPGRLVASLATRTDAHRGPQLSRSFPPVGRVKRGACGRAPP